MAITSDEENVLCIEDSIEEEGRANAKVGLVGRLLSDKPFNKRALKSVMAAN